MAKHLSELRTKKRDLGMEKLGQHIDLDRWLAMLDAGDAAMEKLAEAWPTRRSSFWYDAAPILDLGEASSDPLLDPAPDEVVIRVGPWSLQDLCERDNLMAHQNWYTEYPFYREKLTPGVYRVRLPICQANGMSFAEQKKLFLPGEEMAPAALAAVTLLCHLKKTGKDLLNACWACCAEKHASRPRDAGTRVAVYVERGRVGLVSVGDVGGSWSVLLAGCRKVAES